MALIKFILIVVLVYYIFKFAGRYLLPFLLKFFIKKAGKKQDNQRKSSSRRRKDGEVSIDYMPQKNRNLNTDNVGEYIDFEEFKSNEDQKEDK